MARGKARESDAERLLRPDVARELALAIPGFDRRAFLSAFIDCFGSVEKFARSVYGEYQSAEAGSVAKQRWGSLVCTLLSQESQADQNRRVPVEQMTAQEIHEGIRAMLPKVALGVEPGAADG